MLKETSSILNFILYNYFFELIIAILAFLNYYFLIYLDTKDSSDKTDNNQKLSEISKFKIYSLLLTTVYITIIVVKYFKEYIIFLLMFILPLIALVKSILNTYKNNNCFTIDDKYLRLGATIIFILFFSSFATPIYYNSLSDIPHIIKELLLMFYLILKIVLFVFLLFINFFILLSNVNIIIKTKNIKFDLNKNAKDFKLISYDFKIYRKYNTTKTKIIDNFIFFILCPFTILINVVYFIFLKIVNWIKIKSLNFLKYAENIDTKINKLTRKATNTSLIISLTLVYIITITDKKLFSPNIIEIYSFISTVILIPFIYDIIKQK